MQQRLDPTLCIVLYTCASALGLIMGFFPVLSLLVLPLAILATVFSAMYLYSLWKAIPESARSTTPGKAVGFCFIPFFHFYWFFRAYPSLVKDTERYTGQPGPFGLALTFAIMMITMWIAALLPLLSVAHTLGHYVVWLLMILGMTKHANAALAKQAALAGVGPSTLPQGSAVATGVVPPPIPTNV